MLSARNRISSRYYRILHSRGRSLPALPGNKITRGGSGSLRDGALPSVHRSGEAGKVAAEAAHCPEPPPYISLPLAKPRLRSSISARGRKAQEGKAESWLIFLGKFHAGNGFPGWGLPVLCWPENSPRRGKAPPSAVWRFALAMYSQSFLLGTGLPRSCACFSNSNDRYSG